MSLIRTTILALALLLPTATPIGGEVSLPSLVGETVHYKIKKLGIKAGSAELSFKGLVDMDGQKAYLIVFQAKSLNFFDEEKIFADPKDFYPIRVERDLNIFGKKEKITEIYDVQTGTIRIIKEVNGEVTQQTIKRNEKIDNIYCFIYRYRHKGDFQLGDTLTASLPTRNVRINLESKRKISAGGQRYNAFFMKSEPKQYQLWFADNQEKIPLRIDGAVGFGSTSMIMTKYENRASIAGN